MGHPNVTRACSAPLLLLVNWEHCSGPNRGSHDSDDRVQVWGRWGHQPALRGQLRQSILELQLVGARGSVLGNGKHQLIAGGVEDVDWQGSSAAIITAASSWNRNESGSNGRQVALCSLPHWRVSQHGGGG